MKSGKCTTCGVILTKDNCYPSRLRHSGPCISCQDKHNAKVYKSDPKKAIARQQEWRKNNPEKYAAVLRRSASRVYGSTKEEFDFKLLKQSGLCAICNQAMKKRCQDHDHKTKVLRDILCGGCNSMIGFAKDNIEILASAIRYLPKHSESSSIQTFLSENGAD